MQVGLVGISQVIIRTLNLLPMARQLLGKEKTLVMAHVSWAVAASYGQSFTHQTSMTRAFAKLTEAQLFSRKIYNTYKMPEEMNCIHGFF